MQNWNKIDKNANDKLQIEGIIIDSIMNLMKSSYCMITAAPQTAADITDNSVNPILQGSG